MNTRSGQDTAALNNIVVTDIDLGPAKEVSLAKDIIEVVTGVSSSAINVGGKITAGSIIYTGHETEDLKLANNIFWIGSLIASGIDFALIPLGYLYKYYKKDKVPFNTENNIKWALAGVTLLLAIISAAVAAAGRVISFITAGLAIAVGIASVIKYFYDYKKTGAQFQAVVHKVERLSKKISEEMDAINALQDIIRSTADNDPTKKNLISALEQQRARYDHHCEKIKDVYYLKNSLERKYIRQKSPVDLIFNIVKFGLAGIVLAGTILVPINPVVATAFLATAAFASLLAIIIKKTVQIIQKRIERDHERKRARQIEIHGCSTAKIMSRLDLEHTMPDFSGVGSKVDLMEDAPLLPNDELNEVGLIPQQQSGFSLREQFNNFTRRLGF